MAGAGAEDDDGVLRIRGQARREIPERRLVRALRLDQESIARGDALQVQRRGTG
jgi:hypothetical protein